MVPSPYTYLTMTVIIVAYYVVVIVTLVLYPYLLNCCHFLDYPCRGKRFPPFSKNGKLQFVSLNNFHVDGDKQRRQHFAKLYTRARFVCHSPNRDLYLGLPFPINSIGFILSRDQSANFVSEHKRVDVSSI